MSTLVSLAIDQTEAGVNVGDTTNLTCTGTFDDASTSDQTAFATWASDNAAIASVSSVEPHKGRVTGVHGGVAHITAHVSSVYSAPCPVTVPLLTTVVVSPAAASVAVGESVQMIATAVYNEGSEVDVTAYAVWSSSDPDSASAAAGVVTGLYRTDGAPLTITATYTDAIDTDVTVVGSASLTVTRSVPEGARDHVALGLSRLAQQFR